MLETLLVGVLVGGISSWALWLAHRGEAGQREAILEAYRLAKAVHPAEARLTAEQYQEMHARESAARHAAAATEAQQAAFFGNLGS